MRSILDRPALIALWLLLAMSAALALRVVPGFDLVFPRDGSGAVLFREVDPYYHARAIEHQVANFPERFAFDPYLAPPEGGEVPVAPLFDFAVAAIALATGGRDDARWVEIVAAWFPAIAGALVVLPVALLTRRYAALALARPAPDRSSQAGEPVEKDGRVARAALAAAALAAAIVALLPSQQLARSLLGFADHHVLEVLLSSLFLAALAGALDGARPRRARRASTLLAGVALALYTLAWVGAASLLVLLAVWLVTQFLIDLAARRPLDWAERTALPLFALATAAIAPLYDGVVVARRNLLALVGLLGLSGLLALAVRVGERLARKQGRDADARGAIALAAAGMLAVAATAAALLTPGLVAVVRGEIAQLLTPRDVTAVVREAAPLSSLGTWWQVTWQEFSVAGFVALAALLAGLGRLVVRRSSSAVETLLLVWTTGLVLFSLRQNRFLYYLAVPVAVLAATAMVEIGQRLMRVPGGKSAPSRTGGRREQLAGALLFSGALFAATGFGLSGAIERARTWNGPSGEWRAALAWLRSETPEPFGDAAFYRRPVRRDDPARPRPSYSVAAWWDFGYWILHLARRVPVANPTQAGAGEMGRLLLSADDEEAAGALAALGAAASSGAATTTIAARFLLIDSTLPILFREPGGKPSGKLRSIATWAGKPATRYVERVEQRDAAGNWKAYTIFHPDYFRTLLVRLYLYGGQAISPRGRAHVVELGAVRPSGMRELLRVEAFASPEAAAAALAGRDPSRFALISVDPASTPVALPATQLFRPVWSSPTPALLLGARRVGEIEIFERTDLKGEGTRPPLDHRTKSGGLTPPRSRSSRLAPSLRSADSEGTRPPLGRRAEPVVLTPPRPLASRLAAELQNGGGR